MPCSRASASTHDGPAMPVILRALHLHLPHLKLGSLLIHKTSRPLGSSRSFSCLLCITSEGVSLRLPWAHPYVLFLSPKHHGSALPGQMPGSLEAAYTPSRIFPGKPGPADFLCNSANPPWGSYYCTCPASKGQRNRVLEAVSVTQVACQPWSHILQILLYFMP